MELAAEYLLPGGLLPGGLLLVGLPLGGLPTNPLTTGTRTWISTWIRTGTVTVLEP